MKRIHCNVLGDKCLQYVLKSNAGQVEYHSDQNKTLETAPLCTKGFLLIISVYSGKKKEHLCSTGLSSLIGD